MWKTRRSSARGVTMMELVIAIFVSLIGLVGVIALFPVGVHLSQAGIDDVASAMTLQTALAAVRLQPGILARASPFDANNPNGDVLSWTGSASLGIEGITAVVDRVGTTAVGDQLGLNRIQVTGLAGLRLPGGTTDRTLNTKALGSSALENPRHDCALLLLGIGPSQWKLYRLDNASSFTTFTFASTQNAYTHFPGDGVRPGDLCRLIGARDERHVWLTVPSQFYGDGSGNPPPGGYILGPGAVEGYGYLAVISRSAGVPNSFRVDVLIFKGYDRTLPPEGNPPAVACYTAVLPGEFLQ